MKKHVPVASLILSTLLVSFFIDYILTVDTLVSSDADIDNGLSGEAVLALCWKCLPLAKEGQAQRCSPGGGGGGP